MNRNDCRARFLGALLATVFCVTGLEAQAYSMRDATFVTSSKNLDVLAYVVCLEDQMGQQPRRMGQQEALQGAVVACRADEGLLPRDPSEPTAEDLHLNILECGFRPGTASPDMDCGAGASQANASGAQAQQSASFEPDDLNAIPGVIYTGTWLEGIIVDGDAVWVSESGQRTVSKLDMSSGKSLGSYKVGRLPIDVVRSSAGDTYALIATDKKVVKIDGRGNVTSLTTLKGYPAAMAQEGDWIWVLVEPGGNSGSSQLVRIDGNTGKTRSTDLLSAGGTDIAVWNGQVWLTHAQNNLITVVDSASMRTEMIQLNDAVMYTVASGGDAVYVGGDSGVGGVVVRVNGQTKAETARRTFPEMILRVASHGNEVVALSISGKMWILSADDLTILREVKTQAVGASFRPSDIKIEGDTILVAAGQFLKADGQPVTDAKGKADERGAVLIYNDVFPDNAHSQRAGNSDTGRSPGATRTDQTAAAPTRDRTRDQTSSGGQGNRNTGASAPSRRDASNGSQDQRQGQRQGNSGSRPAATGRNPRAQAAGQADRFPVMAGSRGTNVRSRPDANSTKTGSTGPGQPIELLSNAGGNYQGFPWFEVRLANQQTGYLWGGGICALSRSPVQGTKGTCDRSVAQTVPENRRTGVNPGKPRRDAGNRGSNAKTNENDVIIGMLDLFGAVVDSNNSQKNNGQLFTETLRVQPGGQPALATRRITQDQVVVYSVDGKRGQTLDVTLWSPGSNTVFEIYSGEAKVGGQTLPGAGAGQNAQSFRGRLPKDGTYQIVVGTVSGDADYQLVVAADAVASARPGRTANGAPSNGAPTRAGRAGSAAAVPGFANAPRSATAPSTADQTTSAADTPAYTLGDNAIAVGTYTSSTGPAGNIEMDKNTSAISWRPFCDDSIALTPDWEFGQLMTDTRPQGALVLDIRDDGGVIGFQYGANTYTLGASIQPMCGVNVADIASIATFALPDGTKPGQELVDYCEQGSGKGTPGAQACVESLFIADTLNFIDTTDTRKTTNDYSAITLASLSRCMEGSPNGSAPFYDCLDNQVAHINRENAGNNTDSGPMAIGADGREEALPDPGYVDYSLPDGTTPANGLYFTCAKNHGERTNDYDVCVQKGFVAETLGGAETIDPRKTANDYRQIMIDSLRYCMEGSPNGSAPFYDCLDNQVAHINRENASNNTDSDPMAIGADGQEDGVGDARSQNDYSAVSAVANGYCDKNNPTDGPFFDCMDNQLQVIQAYGELTVDQRLECEARGIGSDNYKNCLNETLQTIREGRVTTDGNAVPTDSEPELIVDGADSEDDDRAGKDYAAVAGSDRDYCDQNNPTDFPYFNCMDDMLIGTVGYDPNPGGRYNALPADVLATCQGDVSCLDAGVMQAQRANAQGADNNAAADPEPVTADSDQLEVDVEALRQQIAEAYSDLTYDERLFCEQYGIRSQDNEACLNQALDSFNQLQIDNTALAKAQAEDADLRQQYAEAYSQLTEQERLDCEQFGLGSVDYGNCLNERLQELNVRQIEAESDNSSDYQQPADTGGNEPQPEAQPAPEPEQEPTQEDAPSVAPEITDYCSQNVEGDDKYNACVADLYSCQFSYSDIYSNDFIGCAQGTGW
ncbi:SH3 domain-containing protein [Pseudorhodobacter antarcticus]|uniref:SH3 domain-containing protein n=1 Tax=Pseudorhodobacter antarcticus TaxID=1077947 RepID=A0A1H8MUI9_9RHOB|nr:SH3 domain-containing protein [Pseudorhodobacter antarcticus]SEO20939.1 SH3 domain-containing protein [Pseudorhodobacter antarcticus]